MGTKLRNLYEKIVGNIDDDDDYDSFERLVFQNSILLIISFSNFFVLPFALSWE